MDCKCLSQYDSFMLPYQRVLNNEVLHLLATTVMNSCIELKYHNEITSNNLIKKTIKLILNIVFISYDQKNYQCLDLNHKKQNVKRKDEWVRGKVN